jgi:hypothetical protein
LVASYMKKHVLTSMSHEPFSLWAVRSARRCARARQ